MAIRRRPIFVFFAAVQLTYPVLYYFVQADMRYRDPLIWASLVGTGYLIVALTDRRVPRSGLTAEQR